MTHAPHPFSLRQLQYAVAVADTLSFRKAAEACHVSQPSLSAQLAQIENVLGVRLFERDRRRVIVTAAGRELVERARRILRDTDDLVALARRSGDPLSGTLRLGVIPTISPYLLPGLTPALRSACPQLTALWVEGKTAELVQSLEAGNLDAALLALEAEIGDVECEVIARDPFFLVAPKDHPLGRRTTPATASSLHGESVLLLDETHCFGTQALSYCSEVDARAHAFRATSIMTIMQMVASGAGVTLLPELALKTEVRSAALRVRRLARPAPQRTIALVWRRTSPMAPALRLIAATVRKAFPQGGRSRSSRRR